MCEVWLADSPGLSLPSQFKLTAAPCNLSQLDSLQLQPLCEKAEPDQAGGFFLGSLLQSLLSLHRTIAKPPPACPPTMRRVGERCLLVRREVLNYQEARDHCRQEGLQLITVDRAEEGEEMRRLVEFQVRCQTIPSLSLCHKEPAKDKKCP